MSPWVSFAAEAAGRGLETAIEVALLGGLLWMLGRGLRRAPLACAVLAIGVLKFAIALAPVAGAARLPIPLPRLTAVESEGLGGWLALAFAAWVVGASIQALRLLGDARGLAAVRRDARARGDSDPELTAQVRAAAQALGVRAPEVLISSRARAPFVSGWLRPALVMPVALARRLDAEALRGVVLHELAHLKRGDLAWIGLSAALSVAWWWHPVFWMLVARLRSAQEHACDDLALLVAGAAPRAYCETLLEAASHAVAPGARPGLLAPAGLTGVALERRIRRLMDPHAKRQAGLAPWQRLAIVALALVVLPAAAPTSDFDLAGSPASDHAARHRAAHAHHHHP